MGEERSGEAVDVKLMSLDSSDAAQQQQGSVCVRACVCMHVCVHSTGSARVKATSQT